MLKVQNFVKSGYANLDSHEVLSSPVNALLGVSDEIAELIKKLEIFTIFDLASSQVFNNARNIVRASESPGTIFAKYEGVPADIIDRDVEGLPIEDLPGLNIQKLSGIGINLGPAFSEALYLETIRDFSLWPPFQAARKIFNDVFNIETDDDSEAPSELLPRAGDYPTERVFYTTVVQISQYL